MVETTSLRAEYERRMLDIRRAFEQTADGLAAIAARTSLVDELVLRLWAGEVAGDAKLSRGIAIAAVGGYGRGQLFPYSDIDLLFLAEKNEAARARDAIRRVSQALWDCGLKVALTTRAPGDCERFEAGNPEFGLSLLDLRPLGGDDAVLSRVRERSLPRLMKDAKAIIAELGALTRERQARFGNTLFHLEPNIKDCPGGLRDVHVADWLEPLMAARGIAPAANGLDFREATAFLAHVRCFLHFRHERDDNTLDWTAQDEAAERRIGLPRGEGLPAVDAAYWMRAYFRHARAVERRLQRQAELAGMKLKSVPAIKSAKGIGGGGFRLKDGRLELTEHSPAGGDAAHDPEVVLAAFAAMSRTGAKLDARSEERIAAAIPQLSANLEEGPALWRQLAAVLEGTEAADALRTMHALGVLELILPEFHGIDALVIRDAYHRYTVDEHTFVLIETLHNLEREPENGSPEWRVKFGAMVRELQNPALLYLAALLHDTGKGRSGAHHATESARLAESVCARLEMDSYEASQVLRLILAHLEMSAALRRDIFDAETVRTFAGKVQTHELLRMLTVFTYADINAVHPDALTPWKAENLWRLSMATANQLDRNVDEERVHATEVRVGSRRGDDRVARIRELAGTQRPAVDAFLEGFPERYLQTRSPEAVLRHFEMTKRFDEEPIQIELRHRIAVSEITLVTRDRPSLFAAIAAALAAWGMNVVTADGFANAAGVVVDSFRFTDTYSTLELNESERERFVRNVREVLAGRASIEKMLSSRRRARRPAPRVEVKTRVEFDDTASSHSTLLQIVAQDVPGLLRAVSAAISEAGVNVEVALVDTEGETAIDVFYLTSSGERLTADQKTTLREALVEAIRDNAQ